MPLTKSITLLPTSQLAYQLTFYIFLGLALLTFLILHVNLVYDRAQHECPCTGLQKVTPVPGARFSKDTKTYQARKAIFNDLFLKKKKQCIGIELCMEVNFVHIKIA